MIQEHGTTFIQTSSSDSEEIIRNKAVLNSLAYRKEHSYINSTDVKVGKLFNLDDRVNLIIEFKDYCNGFEYVSTVTARNNSIIRLNTFSNNYSSFKIQYIPVSTLFSILTSEKNTKEYKLNFISEPSDCRKNIINSNLVAVNMIRI